MISRQIKSLISIALLLPFFREEWKTPESWICILGSLAQFTCQKHMLRCNHVSSWDPWLFIHLSISCIRFSFLLSAFINKYITAFTLWLKRLVISSSTTIPLFSKPLEDIGDTICNLFPQPKIVNHCFSTILIGSDSKNCSRIYIFLVTAWQATKHRTQSYNPYLYEYSLLPKDVSFTSVTLLMWGLWDWAVGLVFFLLGSLDIHVVQKLTCSSLKSKINPWNADTTKSLLL